MSTIRFRHLGCSTPNQSPPMFVNAAADTSLAFALTTPDHSLVAAMSGTARPLVLDRFASLAEAMRGAIVFADQFAFDARPPMLAILDCDDRLVLAGAATDGAVAWCLCDQRRGGPGCGD